MTTWESLTPEQQAESRRVWDAALANPRFVEALERGKADLAAGRVVQWSDVKRRLAMTDDQARTPKPGDPEPAPPTEETEPALEDADTTTTTTTETTTEDDPA